MTERTLANPALCPRWRSGRHFFAPATTMDAHGVPVGIGVCVCGLAASGLTNPDLAGEITKDGLRGPSAGL